MEKKICCDCGQEKELDKFQKCFDGHRKFNTPGYDDRNPSGTRKNRCKSCYSARERTKALLDFYDGMGGECECCGEKDIRFLTLDHRNNDGNKQRESLQCFQIVRLARKEGFPKEKYAILCYNCNLAKSHRGNGICPHKSGESLQLVLNRMRESIRLVGTLHRKKETGKRPWKSVEMKGKKYGARITESQVAEIKSLKGTGILQREVAERFKVSRPLVGMIWSGKRWG